MTLSCSVCADLLMFTDQASSTPCGHIFHESCLSRWLNSNRSCPHCRTACTLNSAHRIYLPESHFEKNDILEKLTEVAIAKQEQEKAIKELEKNNKKLEFELKAKKKQYQKILNRSRRISKHSKTINIPRAGVSGTNSSNTASTSASTSRSTNATSQSATEKNIPSTSRVAQDRPKTRRNISRVNRAKAYFRRKKEFFQNTGNNNNNNTADRVASSSEDELTMAV